MSALRLLLFLLLLAPATRAANPPTKHPPAFSANLRESVGRFNARDFDGALEYADRADKVVANTPFVLNIRAAVAIERKQYDEGKRLCEASLKGDPKFFPARFNLGEIPFAQKQYAEARAVFEALLAEDPKNELLLYRIFLTQLLEGDDAAAQATMERIPFPSKTTAYYYTRAAWDFKQGKTAEAQGWIRSGDYVFPPPRNANFADVLIDLGWLQPAGVGGVKPE